MNARDWALLELDARRLPGWKPNLRWKPKLTPRQRDRSPPTDPRDLALAERIVIGVIKNHALLVHLALHYAKRSEHQIDPLVMKILAVALYQLRFMDRVPASAAVDEAVEQCRRFGRARAAGFVNAVLRNATRQPDVPLPDPQRDPEAHAAIALSHPRELFRRLTQVMSIDDALAFCRHDNAEPPTLVRLFRGVSADQLAAEGVIIVPHEQNGIHIVTGAKRAQIESWARQGLAQVQDATSARAVAHMDLRARPARARPVQRPRDENAPDPRARGTPRCDRRGRSVAAAVRGIARDARGARDRERDGAPGRHAAGGAVNRPRLIRPHPHRRAVQQQRRARAAAGGAVCAG